MNSNPVVIIDSQVVDIQSQLAKRASCIYRIVSTENLVADKMTKTWASELHEKHALNRTGFGDVQEVLGWFSADLETVDTNI